MQINAFAHTGIQFYRIHDLIAWQEKDVIVNILGRDITKQKRKEEQAAKEKKEKNYIINTSN